VYTSSQCCQTKVGWKTAILELNASISRKWQEICPLTVNEYIHTYIYEIYNALIVEDGSNQRRGLLLGGGV